MGVTFKTCVACLTKDPCSQVTSYIQLVIAAPEIIHTTVMQDNTVTTDFISINMSLHCIVCQLHSFIVVIIFI